MMCCRQRRGRGRKCDIGHRGRDRKQSNGGLGGRDGFTYTSANFLSDERLKCLVRVSVKSDIRAHKGWHSRLVLTAPSRSACRCSTVTLPTRFQTLCIIPVLHDGESNVLCKVLDDASSSDMHSNNGPDSMKWEKDIKLLLLHCIQSQ